LYGDGHSRAPHAVRGRCARRARQRAAVPVALLRPSPAPVAMVDPTYDPTVRVKDGVRVVAMMRNASARARRARRSAKERVWTSCLGALTFGPAVGRWTIV